MDLDFADAAATYLLNGIRLKTVSVTGVHRFYSNIQIIILQFFAKLLCVYFPLSIKNERFVANGWHPILIHCPKLSVIGQNKSVILDTKNRLLENEDFFCRSRLSRDLGI